MRTIGLLAALVAAGAYAAPPPPPLPHHASGKSHGVASCASSLCHGSIEPWTDSRVLQTEYVTWSRADKHARAYAVLLNERSQEMARKLRLPEPAHRSAVCLDCHAHNVPVERRGERFVLADGVQCESCHGPSERWLRSHVAPRATHAENVSRGLYPIHDPVARARLCLSCHFGNAQKFVTHAMMAAGHPRMSFELDTFVRIQPSHAPKGGAGKRASDGVRDWAIGQVLAATALLEILLDARRGRDGLFPELVLFDCHACHHPMSARRDAGARLRTRPGVVRLNDANFLMVRQIARRMDPALGVNLSERIARLHGAIAQGDDTFEQARELHRALESLLPRILAYRMQPEDLRAIALGLIADGLAGEYSDYQGAEQAAMGLQAVVDQMARRRMVAVQTVKSPLARMLTALADDERYPNPAFESVLRELRRSLEAYGR